MLAAVARLGSLASAQAPLEDLTEVARASAADGLGCAIAVDDDLALGADRPLTAAETDFLSALSHVLGSARRAQHRDPLTGLPNRVLLEDRTTGALARLRRGAHLATDKE